MKLKLCEGCLTQLAGKQRQFCSDRCRKRVIRKSAKSASKSDTKPAENTVNFEPSQLFSQFSDILSDLDDSQFEAFQRQMTLSLSSSIEYQAIWVKRCLANPGKFHTDRAEIHQTCGELLQNILDFLQELHPEGGTK